MNRSVAQNSVGMRILVAEDDVDDRTLAALAFGELEARHELEFVMDGQQLIDNLRQKVETNKPLPDLVLLDLNMPRKDGREALREMKESTDLSSISVVIFSTSSAPEDVQYTRKLGAANYFVKPSDYTQLLKVVRTISG